VVADHVEELDPGRDPRHAAAEVAGSRQTLRVGTGELAHEERAARYAEAAADKIVVVEHDVPLLVE